jgi:hypothetical protein
LIIQATVTVMARGMVISFHYLEMVGEGVETGTSVGKSCQLVASAT